MNYFFNFETDTFGNVDSEGYYFFKQHEDVENANDSMNCYMEMKARFEEIQKMLNKLNSSEEKDAIKQKMLEHTKWTLDHFHEMKPKAFAMPKSTTSNFHLVETPPTKLPHIEEDEEVAKKQLAAIIPNIAENFVLCAIRYHAACSLDHHYNKEDQEGQKNLPVMIENLEKRFSKPTASLTKKQQERLKKWGCWDMYTKVEKEGRRINANEEKIFNILKNTVTNPYEAIFTTYDLSLTDWDIERKKVWEDFFNISLMKLLEEIMAQILLKKSQLKKTFENHLLHEIKFIHLKLFNFVQELTDRHQFILGIKELQNKPLSTHEQLAKMFNNNATSFDPLEEELSEQKNFEKAIFSQLKELLKSIKDEKERRGERITMLRQDPTSFELFKKLNPNFGNKVTANAAKLVLMRSMFPNGFMEYENEFKNFIHLYPSVDSHNFKDNNDKVPHWDGLEEVEKSYQDRLNTLEQVSKTLTENLNSIQNILRQPKNEIIDKQCTVLENVRRVMVAHDEEIRTLEKVRCDLETQIKEQTLQNIQHANTILNLKKLENEWEAEKIKLNTSLYNTTNELQEMETNTRKFLSILDMETLDDAGSYLNSFFAEMDPITLKLQSLYGDNIPLSMCIRRLLNSCEAIATILKIEKEDIFQIEKKVRKLKDASGNDQLKMMLHHTHFDAETQKSIKELFQKVFPHHDLMVAQNATQTLQRQLESERNKSSILYNHLTHS